MGYNGRYQLKKTGVPTCVERPLIPMKTHNEDNALAFF